MIIKQIASPAKATATIAATVNINHELNFKPLRRLLCNVIAVKTRLIKIIYI